MKNCKKCGKPLENTRRSYCSESCKWHYNMLKQEREKHLPPVRKRNRNYFKMAVGASFNLRGQGRRAGGMIRGSMAAMIPILQEQIAKVTKENLERHFAGIPAHQYFPTGITFGDGTYIKKEEIFNETGIQL